MHGLREKCASLGTTMSGAQAARASRALVRCGWCGLVEPYQLDLLAGGGESDATVLERERVLAEELAAPARERRHVGGVGGGDQLEILGARHQLLRDAVLLAAQLQEHAQQVDQRSEAWRQLAARWRLRMRVLGEGEGVADHLQNLAAEPALDEALAEAAGTREVGGRAGRV